MIEYFSYALMIWISLAGWGSLFRIRMNPNENFYVAAAVGVIFPASFGLLINFFVPLSPELGMFLLLLGLLLGLLAFRKKVFQFSIAETAVALSVLFLATAYAIDNNLLGDSALYHVPILQWMKNEKIVLGLGNLHDRFSFDSLFLFAQALWTFHWGDRNLAELLGPVLLCNFLMFCGQRSWQRRDPFYGALLFAITILWGKEKFYIGLGSPSPDLPASIFSLWLLVIFYEVLRKDPQSPLQEKFSALPQQISFLFLCFALAVLTKISQAGFIAPLLWLLLRRQWSWAALRLPVIVVLVTGVLWLFRNWLLSGCFLFPVQMTCTSTPWTVSDEVIREIQGWIKSWPRDDQRPYAEVLRDHSWLWPWILRHLKTPYFALTLIVTAAGLFRARLGTKTSPPYWILSSLLGIFLLYWFVTAPDLRFGSAAFLILFALNAALFWALFKPRWRQLFLLVWVLVVLQDHLRIAAVPSRLSPLRAERFPEGLHFPTTSLASHWGVSYLRQVNASDGSGGCFLANPPCAFLVRDNLKEDFIMGYRVYMDEVMGTK